MSAQVRECADEDKTQWWQGPAGRRSEKIQSECCQQRCGNQMGASHVSIDDLFLDASDGSAKAAGQRWEPSVEFTAF